MRALIVGCGYVGLPLGAELVRHGHEVFGLRRSASADAELSAAGITPLHADLTQPGTLTGLPRDCDWIVSCAASGGGDAAAYRQLYLEGSRNLIERLSPGSAGDIPAGNAARRWDAGAPRFVYISSTAVYGQDDGSLVDESSPTEPESPTAKVLVEAEQFLMETARQNKFSAVILRVAGIYGPGRGYWLKQFLSGEARIEGDGGRFLNMVHRDDVVGAIIAVLQRPPHPSPREERARRGVVEKNAAPLPDPLLHPMEERESSRMQLRADVFNVVDEEPVTQRDVFVWLAETLRRPLPPVVSANPESGRKRTATNKRVSNQRLREQFGYHFKYATFREGYTSELPNQ